MFWILPVYANCCQTYVYILKIEYSFFLAIYKHSESLLKMNVRMFKRWHLPGHSYCFTAPHRPNETFRLYDKINHENRIFFFY